MARFCLYLNKEFCMQDVKVEVDDTMIGYCTLLLKELGYYFYKRLKSNQSMYNG